ncbi:MAG: CCA tRNA nucleotidyltransferase [Myxococcales bacterium]|nr:CCA tRNA nucleotidyltransferase [Myxococcales bacterium]
MQGSIFVDGLQVEQQRGISHVQGGTGNAGEAEAEHREQHGHQITPGATGPPMSIDRGRRPQVPERVRTLLRGVRDAGGRGVLVGGCVRDAVMGRRSKDLDIEVHDLDADALRAVLKQFGRVDEVGRAFGVFKLRLGGTELDVCLPRRDRKVGAGHTGIHATPNPGLGFIEAARRRDLTINAISWDPLVDELIDPFDGVSDIVAGRLRAVDATTFGEDPLRALRVVQFAARFAFEVDPALVELCRTMPLGELPPERIRGEVERLLLLSPRPSVGWRVAVQAELWARVLPAWQKPCPPAVDRLATLAIDGEPRRLAVLLAATGTAAEVDDVLRRLQLHGWSGYAVREQALALAQARDDSSESRSPDTRARHLAERLEVELFAALVDDVALARAAEGLGVGRAPLCPLIGGRDLLALGLPAGPEVGRLLAKVRAQQLDGNLVSPEAALAWARTRMR